MFNTDNPLVVKRLCSYYLPRLPVGRLFKMTSTPNCAGLVDHKIQRQITPGFRGFARDMFTEQ